MCKGKDILIALALSLEFILIMALANQHLKASSHLQIISTAVIKQDKDLNVAVYGKEKVDAFQKISEHGSNGIMIFTKKLNHYSVKQEA